MQIDRWFAISLSHLTLLLLCLGLSGVEYEEGEKKSHICRLQKSKSKIRVFDIC